MIRRRSRLLALATIALLSATPVSAQSGGTGCPAPSAIEQNDQITIGQTWLPMRIGIEVAKASCRVNDFLANFFKRQPDPDKATLDDVVEAAKPNNAGGDAGYQAKLRNIPSPTKSPGWNSNPTTSIVVLPPNTSGGEPVLFQPNAPGGPTPTSVSEIQGNGTLLSAEGMKRGTFRGGKLNGIGEEIDPNGTWRGGTFQNGTNMGYVYEVRTVNGKTYIAAGSVVNGKLDGMIERVYADGSTQFEDWENGQLVQVGVRAPKGQAALAPQARYKPPVEVATEDAYKHTGPRTPIAPGTTFDPARSVTAPYTTQIPNPVLPVSFYTEHSGHNLPISECIRQGNDPVWTARLNSLPSDGSTAQALRNVIIATEVALVNNRQCEQVPGGQAELNQMLQTRAQAIINCEQMASSPSMCLAPYRP